MKTAARAFTTGMFTTLGAGTAIVGVIAILVIVGERKVKGVITELGEFMAEQNESLLTMVYGAGAPDKKEEPTG